MASFDYTQYNRDELISHIQSEVINKTKLQDIYAGSTVQTYIRTFAALVDQLHYYIERRVQESYLTTARLATSVNTIAGSYGYRPPLRTAPNGTIEVDILDNAGNSTNPSGTIKINKFDKLSYKGNEYYTTEEKDIDNNTSLPVSVKIKQGVLHTQTFDTTVKNTTFDLNSYILVDANNYRKIDESSIEITTQDNTFTSVDEASGNQPPIGSLTNAGSDDKVYDIRLSNDGMRIYFGNGINGYRPVGTVTIKYIITEGANLSVPLTGRTFLFSSPKLSDDLGNSYDYSVTNTTPIDGGKNEQSLTRTQELAPDRLKTNDRMVRFSDFETFIIESGIAGLVAIKVYGEQKSNLSPNTMNNVNATYLKSNGNDLTSTEHQDLIDYIDWYKVAVPVMILKNASFCQTYYDIKCWKSDNTSLPNTSVYTRVKDYFTDYYKFDADSLGREIYKSQIVDDILDNLKDPVTNKALLRHVILTVYYANKVIYPESDVQYLQLNLGNDGDTYEIDLDNGTETYSYTQQSNDNSAGAVIDEIVEDITLNSSNYEAVKTDTNEMTLTKTDGTAVDVDTSGSTNQDNFYVYVDKFLLIEYNTLDENTGNEDLILKNSLVYMDSTKTTIGTDNGTSIFGNNVDYVNGKVRLPIYDITETYYIQYKQTDVEIFKLNDFSVFELLEPKAKLNDPDNNEFSSISIQN